VQAASWLEHYDEGMPATLGPYPERTLLDYLDEAASERPDGPALLFKGHTVTHGELQRLSDAFAAALAALGVAKGDRVALLLPNCPQFLICELGAWKAGAVVVPLNPIYTEPELAGGLARTGAETIVVLTPFYGRVKAVQPRTALRRVVATNIKEYLPPLLRVLFTLARERKGGHRVRLEVGDLWLPDLLGRHRETPRRDGRAGPGDQGQGRDDHGQLEARPSSGCVDEVTMQHAVLPSRARYAQPPVPGILPGRGARHNPPDRLLSPPDDGQRQPSALNRYQVSWPA